MTGTFPFAISDAIVFFNCALAPKPPANRIFLAPEIVEQWFSISRRDTKRHIATLVDDALLFYPNEADADKFGLAALDRIFLDARFINYPRNIPKSQLPNPTGFARAVAYLKAYLAWDKLPIGHKISISFQVPFVNFFEEINATQVDVQEALQVINRQQESTPRLQSHVLVKTAVPDDTSPAIFPYVKHLVFRGAIPEQHRDALQCPLDEALSSEFSHWMWNRVRLRRSDIPRIVESPSGG
jgi:hypothetical protein